jgi:glycosyltransferase involved in cell wall biosynthesis
MRHKVLIISYFFPPAQEIGALRVGKLAKYLQEFGWDPIILTVDKVQGAAQTMPLEIEESKIKRTKYFIIGNIITKWFTPSDQITIENRYQQNSKKKILKKITAKLLRFPKSVLNLPVINHFMFDPMGWYFYGVKAGLEIISKNDIEVIYSSFGPSTSVLIASRLQKKTKIPWVAEFRDQWSMNPYEKQTQPFHLLEQWWEKKTVKNCAYFIDVSETIAKVQEKLHSKKSLVIPNGFDEEDYLENVPIIPKFCVTYTGRIYPGKTDPSPLFQALVELDREKKITPKDIEINFFGSNVVETIKPIAEKYNISEYIKIFGQVPFKKSIEKQKESTILLLLAWNDPRNAGVLSGKIFEYIGASKPVLALAMRGNELDYLIKETGCGIIVSNVNEIKSVLTTWLHEYENEGKITSFYDPKMDNINKYTRREQARKVAELLEKINSDIS